MVPTRNRSIDFSSGQILGRRFPSLGLLILLLLGLLLSVNVLSAQGGGAGAAADTAAFPEVVARVSGQEIGKLELLTQAALIRARMRQGGQGELAKSKEFYGEILDGLIGEVLVFQHAKREGLGASQEEVAAKISQMTAQFPDAAAFDKALAEQGTNRQKLQRQLEQSLSVQGFIEREIASQIEIPEASIRSFYDENLDRMAVPERRRVRHILLRAARTASSDLRDDALIRAQTLRQRLAAGTDFAGLAKIHSEDEASKQKGGELGWIQQTGRRPEFESAVFDLQIDELSEAVETAAGYHIVQLLEIRAGKTPSLEEVSSRIEERLRSEIIQREVSSRVESLRQTAEVEILI
jgi:parvulin-like peptidyl-prolyl isomerase